MVLAETTGIVKIILILVSAVFCNNMVLSRIMGICPFLGVSKRVETATGMGLACHLLSWRSASLFTWLVQLLLDALGIGYLQTIAYILVIAALVQFVEMFLQKSSPTLYRSLGIYLPLITTNCAVLGVAVLNFNAGYGLLESVVNGVGGALGFLLAIVLMAGIRERQELSDAPKSMQGFPMGLVTAGLMSIAFLGFSGIIK